jgi:sugar-specific transcriptional regulator TrmB
MEQLTNILKKIGLTQTESALYMAGLQYPSLGVNELEKQTGIKRTTIYHALDTLMQKGLVAKVGTEFKTRFSMTKPENIKLLIDKEIAQLKSKKQDLDEIIPLLNQKRRLYESDIRVSHYEGIEGIKLIVEEALYCKSHHWDIIAPTQNFFSEFDKEYAKYYLQTRKENRVTTRSLWEYSLSEQSRALTPEEIRERSPRYLPKVMHGKFNSVIIIFDDKVAFITSLKELSGILVQSHDIHTTISAVFEGLWSASQDYTEKIKKILQ